MSRQLDHPHGPHRFRLVALAAGVALAAALAAPAEAAPQGEPVASPPADVRIDPSLLAGLELRALGPATMSGRISAIDAVPADPLVVYVGSASGGVWKSDDGGVRFEPIFDEHAQSIGDVVVAPSNPDVVWVGTGESWVRNSVSVGDGVYRSEDAGKTWKHVGLADTERVSRIRVHPEDPGTAWVCATGHLWDANEERGVFKTTDAGESWEKVLYVDADTGCSDLAIDPQDPEVLWAGMWQFRRYPDFFESGGPGSGLYRSRDGGESWEEVTEGLPEGDLGRIGIAIAPSRPSVLYAVVEAEETALYRSDDAGTSWEKRDSSFNTQARPFYFATVHVDPVDWNTVYKPGLYLGISIDGGESFGSLLSGGFGGGVHSDHHDLWIDPRDRNTLLLGTDGGLYVSHDRGTAWRHVEALPVSQFYHVAADDRIPYNVYGGLQDNGTWVGPSRADGGVAPGDWRFLHGGDGFWALPDPHEPDFVFLEYQGGELRRVDLATGETREIKPYAGEGEPELRFNWDTPIHLSPNTPGTVYVGAQYLFRSRDRGESWERVSPDLTTNDPSKQRQAESGGLSIDNSTAENHTTIYTLQESPLDARVIWVGTDDGRLQLTRDGGETWTDVVGNVPGLPEGTWVSSVAAGRHDPATAYATFDGHRTGDMETYVYRTTDFGASWERLAGGEAIADGEEPEIDGYTHVVLEDPVDPDLLFVGTETGLFTSLDGGRRWARLEALPPVAVRDLVVQERNHDLVAATHGRGIWILDDLTPLRSLDAETLGRDVALLPTRPAVQWIEDAGGWFGGDAEWIARDLPEAATIAFYQKKRHLFGDLSVEVLDADGEVLTTLPASKRRGVVRVHWPMRLPPPKVPPASSLIPAFEGPRVPEGTYTVRLTKGDEVLTGQVEIAPDPRSRHSAEDRALQQATALELYEALARMTFLIDAVSEARDALGERAGELAQGRRPRRAVEAAADELEALRASLVATSEAGWLSGEEKLREELGTLYGGVVAYAGRPTGSQLDRAGVLLARLDDAFERFESIVAGSLAEANRELARRDLEPVEVLSREAWEARQE